MILVYKLKSVGKAKRLLSKICSLSKRRKELSVKLGIDLCKSLVRPHLEYAKIVWANISDKDIENVGADSGTV